MRYDAARGLCATVSRPLRLLLFNLKTDESDPVLGFASGWIRALASHCAYIDVLTMHRGEYALPANVRVFSAGRERGWSRPARLARFYALLSRLLLEREYDACFAHMTPLFAGLAGPLLTARGIPTTLWYTHRQRSRQLWLGMRLARRVVSADASSFPFATDKLRVLGHGIDTDFFSPSPQSRSLTQDDRGASLPRPAGAIPDARDSRALVVQVGRLAAIKHQATTISAVAGTAGRLALIGGVQAGGSGAYKRKLENLARESGLAARCHFIGDQSRSEVRQWCQRATVAINMSPPGLFDKAALESMACAAPTVVCNPAFAPLLGEYRASLLTDGPEDVAGLRERLQRLFAMSDAERASIGATLRQNVAREHSLDRLTTRLLALLRTGELPRN